MVIERRSEAVQKGHDTESWASLARPVTVTGRARRSTKQSFDLFDEDSREGRDCVGPVSEGAAQPLRHGDHPLPHGNRRDDVIDEMGGGLRHVPAIAGWAHPAPLARERDDKPLAAARTERTAEPEAEDAALEIAAEFLLDVARHGPLRLVTGR